MNFPNIDPTAFEIFGLSIKWYGIAYAVGFLGGYFYAKFLTVKYKKLEAKVFEDIIVWAALGAIVGGRLGYALFYNYDFYINNISLILLDIRRGGMSFHGGLLGVIFFCLIFSLTKRIKFLPVMDIIACCVPIGLFFGRLANFVNGELWGKLTDMPWGIVFPNGGSFPRHPSQIYEAFLEGILLFIILSYIYSRMKDVSGFTATSFLILYGFFRTLVEFFREPDPHIGYIKGDLLSMGILLSLPMIIIGFFVLILIIKCQKK